MDAIKTERERGESGGGRGVSHSCVCVCVCADTVWECVWKSSLLNSLCTQIAKIDVQLCCVGPVPVLV